MRHPKAENRKQASFDQLVRTADLRTGSASARVVRFVDENREVVLASSAAELGARTGTSDATVLRTIQGLGFAGLNGLKQAILNSLASASSPASDMRRTLAELEQSTGEALDSVFQVHREGFNVVRSKTCRSQMAAAVHLLEAAQRIVVFGIGPSADLASYLARVLARTGRDSLTLDATGSTLADQMLALHKGDAIFILAYGPLYGEVMAVFGEARSLGLPTVLMTEALGTELAKMADVVVAVPRGRPGSVALHGATLVALEGIALSLAAAKPAAALKSLDRLADLRRAIAVNRRSRSPSQRKMAKRA